MQLEYLIFDSTDEADGSCSFDALASVVAERMPALGDEIAAVLRWARHTFGAPAAFEDGGDWDFHLQARGEDEVPLPIGYDLAQDEVAVVPAVRGRVSVALTLSGSRSFADAFNHAFPETA
jgi:hypothetical protein